MIKWYPYPCENHDDCLDFLNGVDISFEEFCMSYCLRCPFRVVLDVPYFNDVEDCR